MSTTTTTTAYKEKNENLKRIGREKVYEDSIQNQKKKNKNTQKQTQADTRQKAHTHALRHLTSNYTPIYE